MINGKILSSESKVFSRYAFDKGLFTDMYQDDVQAVEDLVAFEYQSSATSAKRCAELLGKLKKGNDAK